MKRYGNIYESIYNYDNLVLAHENARKGKTFYNEVKMVGSDVDYYIKQIQEMLINKTYKTSEYEVFIKRDGVKDREIYKLPYYPDRIVQWALIQKVEPIFLNKLSGVTHSAIPCRGIHSAFKQVDRYMKDVECTKYCLKLDVKKFYPSIDQQVLKDMYASMFKDEKLLNLISGIIDSTGSGVPIGNYISQYSGNLYLAGLDYYIKHELKTKYYSRYMDDLVLFADNKEELHRKLELITEFLKDIKLTVKDNYQIFPSRTRGVDFVGYRHFGDYILLRKSISKKLIKKMRYIKKKMDNGGTFNYNDYCSINSYKGWLKWCNGHNLYAKWIKPLEPYCDKYYKEVIKNESIQKS